MGAVLQIFMSMGSLLIVTRWYVQWMNVDYFYRFRVKIVRMV